MAFLHRFRVAFIGINSALIVLFAVGTLVAPEQFWGVASSSGIERLASWFLLVFGGGGLLIARRPERHAVVVGLLGTQKVGAFVFFAYMITQSTAVDPVSVIVSAFDAIMAVLLIVYAIWLARI